MHPYSSSPDGYPPPSIVDKAYAKLDPWPRTVNKREELSEKAYVLLPSTIFGFRLQAKKWSEHIPSASYVIETTCCVRGV